MNRRKFSWSVINTTDDPYNNDYYAYYGEEELGFIEYYRKWKKWVWNQGEDIIISSDCLKEILEMLNRLEKNEP